MLNIEWCPSQSVGGLILFKLCLTPKRFWRPILASHTYIILKITSQHISMFYNFLGDKDSLLSWKVTFLDPTQRNLEIVSYHLV